MGGTAAEYSFSDGGIIRGDHALGDLNVGPGKPEDIFAQTCRPCRLCRGDPDVAIEMLSADKFSLIVNHDDAEREFAYTECRRGLLRQGKGTGLDGDQHEGQLETVFQGGRQLYASHLVFSARPLSA